MKPLRTLARRGRHWRGRFAAFARAEQTRAAIQSALVVLVSVLSVVVIVVAVGAAAGRFQVAPVHGAGRDVRVSSSSAVVVVPVPTATLDGSDLVRARTDRDHRERLYRVEAIDSYTHEVFTIDGDGKLLRLRLGSQAGRVSRVIPWVGAPFALLLGSAQVVLLLAIAGALFLWSTFARWRARATSSSWRRRRTIAVRFVAGVMFCLGTLAITASASFTKTATDVQAINTGVMTLSVGSTNTQANRLDIAATDLAPGDRIQREIDLTVSGAASAIPTSGMTFQIASSNGLDATYGLKIWITRCDRSNGANGWTETASGAPPWTYACNIGDATAQDLLNASNATIPSANTCTTDNGTVNPSNGYHAASEYTSPTALQSSHLPLVAGVLPAGTTLHLVVTMCLPTATPDSWQHASNLLTFTFNATQRTAANK